MSPSESLAARGRRRLPLGAVGLLVLLVAAVGWSGYRALQAKDHLESARGQLELARAALLDRRLADAQDAVAKAGGQTRQARDLVDDPITGLLSHVPWAGRTLAVGRGIARSADDIAHTVLPEALRSARVLDPKALRRPDGSVDLGVLQKAQPGIAAAARGAQAVARRIRGLPDSLVQGQVLTARNDFARQVTTLSDTLTGVSDALRVAPALLGKDRPRTYFVLVQQTSESRGTGGLPGGYAILHASRGKLHVTQQGSNADLKSGRVSPTGLPRDYVERYDPFGAFDFWSNINLSPDLPVVSRYIAQRWHAQSGQHVDGVIALDAVALADLLQGGGPVPVGPGQTVAPAKLEDYLALGQYAGNVSDQTARKEKLVGVAKAVIDRLTTGGGDSDALLRGLSSAIRSGHIHIATQDAALAPDLRRTGADGGLPRDAAPFAYPVVFSGGASKLEYFLDRDVTYAGGSCSGSRRTTTVTLKLRTDPPPLAQLPAYVTLRLQDGKQTQSLVDRVGVSFYATKGARLVRATLDGKPFMTKSTGAGLFLEPGTEAGLPVWLTYLDLPPHHSRVVTLTLDEPVAAGTPRVLAQPLARALTSHVTLPAC